MNKEQMAFLATARLTSDQLRGITRDQLRGLARDQLRWLTRDQLRWLTRDQLRWLTRDQLSGLTRDQLSWLTSDQLRWLTRDQLSGLTGDQLSGLTRDDIPVVDKLYTKMWSALSDGRRCIDQSTFGPDIDPATNLCKTPMCIAGHTVNLAGDAGYALMRKVGFVAAARMIHYASSAEPEPRYDIYPNEWALAYIELAAKRESL